MFRLVFLAFHGERRMTAPVPAHPEEEEPAAHFTDTPAKVPPGGAHLTTPTRPRASAGGKEQRARRTWDLMWPPPPPRLRRGRLTITVMGVTATRTTPRWSMAIPLVILAIGSVLAGYVGIPYALGGHNWLHGFLEPSFQVVGAPHYEAVHTAEEIRLERILMAISVGIAAAGIGLAYFFWMRRRDLVDNMARQFHGVHQLLLNKYYVDELYDAAIVQPIKGVSTGALWRGVDIGLIDGAVNGVGRGSAPQRRAPPAAPDRLGAHLRRLAVPGRVLIVGYYLFR
jgi:NADH:ubiquinone oxidoreductase subunit 5 (subunit L)/multisubunit Na+/H+ antiporter MnhA subunit